MPNTVSPRAVTARRTTGKLSPKAKQVLDDIRGKDVVFFLLDDSSSDLAACNELAEVANHCYYRLIRFRDRYVCEVKPDAVGTAVAGRYMLVDIDCAFVGVV